MPGRLAVSAVYRGVMQRAIVGFHQDDRGDWVAELACGHQRHVRHRPPFERRSWVLEAGSRERRLGTLIECGLCDQASAGSRKRR